MVRPRGRLRPSPRTTAAARRCASSAAGPARSTTSATAPASTQQSPTVIHALDNADNLSPGSYAMPDQVWLRLVQRRPDADVDPQWVRGSSWEGERVPQYEAQTTANYGGVALTIDRNYLELDGGSRAPRGTSAPAAGTRVDLPRYPRLRSGSRGARVEGAAVSAAYPGPLPRDASTASTTATSSRRCGPSSVAPTCAETGRVDARTWQALFSKGRTPLLKVGSAGPRRAARGARALRGGRAGVGEGHRRAHRPLTPEGSRASRRGSGWRPPAFVDDATWQALQTGLR